MTSDAIENGFVAVSGGKIVEVGTASALDRFLAQLDCDASAVTHLNLGEAIVLPGLINLHSHLDYAAMRNFDLDSGFFQWIKNLVTRAWRFTPDEWQASALFGAHQAALSGTTLVVDSSYTGLAAWAMAQVGLRGIVGLEIFGLSDERLLQTWSEWLKKLEEFKSRNDEELQDAIENGLIQMTIAPHTPYSVSPSLWQKADEWARENRVPLLCHVAESKQECQWISNANEEVDAWLDFVDGARLKTDTSDRERHNYPWRSKGLSPVHHLQKFNLLGPHVIAAHAVHVTDEDLGILKKHDVRVAHCPRSNSRLRNGAAPWLKMIRHGLKTGLGTDSLASTDDLSLLSELRFAAELHRAMDPEFPLTSEQLLAHVTIESARALSMQDTVGSLAKGKAADIAVFTLDDQPGPHNTYPPRRGENPYDLLIFGPARLKHLFVNGERVVIDGQVRNWQTLTPIPL